MKISKIFSAFLVLQLVFLNVYAQQTEEIENWFNPQDIPLRLEYKRYSREDAELLRNKYLLLKEQSPVDEWEGEYVLESEGLNHHGLIWSNNLGFAEFSIYTCFPTLQYVNYGKIEQTPARIKLIPEIQKDSPRKQKSPETLVKVKWGEIHYLVEEDYLPIFCERAAGLDIKTDNSQNAFPYYFYKMEDLRKETFGLPQLPDLYKKFLRYPIETKILSLDKRSITSDKNEWNGEIEKRAEYSFTIAAGSNQGVKVGMFFFIPDIEEWFEITKVSSKTSIVYLSREADESGSDVCFDSNYEKVSCKNLSVGLQVKTQHNYLSVAAIR